MTRGIRNNNPGNIRISATTHWMGQSVNQTDGAFVQFDSAVYGIRAIVRIMRSYQRGGIRTLHDAINRWAPPNENNSAAYVDAVCDDCKVHPYDNVDLETIMPALVKAIIKHENGSQPYSEGQIESAIAIA